MLQPVKCLTSKLVAPIPEATVWEKPALATKLSQIIDFPVTVVSAGAGYGKTTAVATFLGSSKYRYGWYSLGPEDASVFTVACYLAKAADNIVPGIQEEFADILSRLETARWEGLLASLLSCLEEQTIDSGILVLDDWHLLSQNQEISLFLERFLACKPEWLRLVIVSREKVELPEVSRLSARGKSLIIDERDLAFDLDEVSKYLGSTSSHYTQEQTDVIYRYCEGWVMALSLIRRNFEGRMPLSTQEKIGFTLEGLFEFLALDVLEKQDRELQTFLLKSAVLDYISVGACMAVMGDEFSPRLIHLAKHKGLFLSELGQGQYRYHYLFRDFLLREGERRLKDWGLLHCRAGYYYLQEKQEEQALNHLIQAHQWSDAVEVLAKICRRLAYTGGEHIFENYLNQLPKEYQHKPVFRLALGDVARLSSEYSNALELYQQAIEYYTIDRDQVGLSLALKGLGETYLDIIQPDLAEQYLRRAYKVLSHEHTEEKAEILGLMAENMVNQGKPRPARRYRKLANEMLHLASRGNFEARLLLRTGRLHAAIKALESKDGETESYHPPVSFRETPLLLSLCYAFTGEMEQAEVAAREGIRLGQKLKSPFVEAMAYVRLGHALLVRREKSTRASKEAYQRALELNDSLGIMRGRTEVLMGQCLLYGSEGDWLAAKRCGLEGLKVTEQVRDRWFSAVLLHCLGVAATSCQRPEEGKTYLIQARELFCRCGDSFGKTVANWWLSYIAWKIGNEEEFIVNVSQLLELCEGLGYDFLLHRGTFLGAHDGRLSVPLLLEARRLQIATSYVDWQLHKLGVVDEIGVIEYTLRVQTLGKFRIWRGEQEIPVQEWRRESAKRLFQLLLTKRHVLLHKEEIMVLLWPDAAPESATRDFKVSLNTLLNVLEPNRLPRTPAFFIQREGAAYYFNLASGYWLDVEEFEGLVGQAEEVVAQRPAQAEILLERALELYTGDYLHGSSQEEWCYEERERLMVVYIRAAELLAKLLARTGKYERCLEWADKVLAKDNCWEEAYRLKMYCYGKLNNRAMVGRIYQKCVTVLQEELNVGPSLKTVKLYKKLVTSREVG